MNVIFLLFFSIHALTMIMYKNFAYFLTLHVLSNHNNHNPTCPWVILLRFYRFLLKYRISSSDYLYEENYSKMTISKRTILNCLFSGNFLINSLFSGNFMINSLFSGNFLIKIKKIWNMSCYKIIIFYFLSQNFSQFCSNIIYLCCVTMNSAIIVIRNGKIVWKHVPYCW